MENPECPICFKSIVNSFVITKCHHKFCIDCLFKQIVHKNSCPLCRKKIIKTSTLQTISTKYLKIYLIMNHLYLLIIIMRLILKNLIIMKVKIHLLLQLRSNLLQQIVPQPIFFHFITKGGEEFSKEIFFDKEIFGIFFHFKNGNLFLKSLIIFCFFSK